MKKNLLLRNQWRVGQVTGNIAQFCRITMDKMKKKFDFGGLTPPIHEKGVQCVKCCFYAIILFPLDQPSYFIAMFICRKFRFLGIPVSLIIRIEAQNFKLDKKSVLSYMYGRKKSGVLIKSTLGPVLKKHKGHTKSKSLFVNQLSDTGSWEPISICLE